MTRRLRCSCCRFDRAAAGLAGGGAVRDAGPPVPRPDDLPPRGPAPGGRLQSCHMKGVYKGTPNRCSTATGSAARTTGSSCSSGRSASTCHRPAAWTGGALRPRRQHRHAAQRRAPPAAVPVVPQEQQLQDRRSRLRHLSPEGLPGGAQTPNHVAGGLPDHLRGLPSRQRHHVQPGPFRPPGRVPAGRRHATPGVRHLPPQQHVQGHGAATASAATGRVQPHHVSRARGRGFPTTCENCHRATDTSWRGAAFNHASIFPLVGAARTGGLCHVPSSNNVYRGTPRDCVGCHRADYNRTTSPAHAAAGFPTTCENCHRPTDTSWRGAGFNHASVFPLVGQHAQAACATCHKQQRLRGTPRDCVGCHQRRVQPHDAPAHAAAGFPTTCENCHRATDSSWRGAGLQSRVGVRARRSARAGGLRHVPQEQRLRGTPRDCVGCHQDRLQPHHAPAHAAAGFPTTCENCHRATDTSWRGAGLQPRRGVRAGRPARAAGVRRVPRNNVYRGTPRDCVGCHQRQLQPHDSSPPHASAGFPTTCENCHRAHGQLVEPGHVQPPVPDHLGRRNASVLDLSSVEHAELHVPDLPRALAVADGRQASRPQRLSLRLPRLLQLPSRMDAHG